MTRCLTRSLSTLRAFVLRKKGLHQLFFNARLVAELLDVAGGEVGAALHGQAIEGMTKRQMEAPIIGGAKSNDRSGLPNNRFAHRTELPARYGQQLVNASEAYRPAVAFFGVKVLFKCAYCAPGYQCIAVNA